MEGTKQMLETQREYLHNQQDRQLELLHSQFQAMGCSDQQTRETIALYQQQFQLQQEQLQTQIQGADAMPRKILRDVLYLMIVNLPSEQELEAAKTAMASQTDDGSGEGLVTTVHLQ